MAWLFKYWMEAALHFVTLVEVDLSYIQRKLPTNKIHISILCMARPRSR